MFILNTLLCAGALTFARALTSSLQPFTGSFGPNPTNVSMYSYTPAALASPAPLIVALHYCSETARDYFGRSTLPQLADQHGFILLFPDTPSFGGCWDISSNATLAHNAGGDSLGIASMVRYAVANWNIDSTRVFATGASSGAVMTSVLLGAYPDLFAAGALYSGAPFGCFAALNPYSSSQCATGQIIQTAQKWGDEVRVAMPGFSGNRPRVQFWHGSADTGIFPQNFWEEIKQWTNVFGVNQTPTSNVTGDPEATYSRASFGPNIQALLAQGLGHTVPEHDTETIDWFGLATVVPSGSPPISTLSTSAPSPSPTPVQVHFGQCGGTGWSGPTVCASPFACKVSNPFPMSLKIEQGELNRHITVDDMNEKAGYQNGSSISQCSWDSCSPPRQLAPRIASMTHADIDA